MQAPRVHGFQTGRQDSITSSPSNDSTDHIFTLYEVLYGEENLKKTEPSFQLPKYGDGMAAALLAARESVMAPIRPVLRAHNLTEQQWRLLRVLIDIGPMELTQAAEASLIMAPSLTRIQKDLQKRKLIAKKAHRDDKRRFVLTITREGRRLVEKTAIETGEILAKYKKQFGSRRFNKLIAELAEFRSTIT